MQVVLLKVANALSVWSGDIRFANVPFLRNCPVKHLGATGHAIALHRYDFRQNI